MSDVTGRKRQGRGTPVGGQFAAENKPESDVDLGAGTQRYDAMDDEKLVEALGDAAADGDEEAMSACRDEVLARMEKSSYVPGKYSPFLNHENDALVDDYCESVRDYEECTTALERERYGQQVGAIEEEIAYRMS